MAYDYDLFVIGGGSGGVRCARIAASHGARVGIAEDVGLGRHLRQPGLRAEKADGAGRPSMAAAAADARGFGWDSHARHGTTGRQLHRPQGRRRSTRLQRPLPHHAGRQRRHHARSPRHVHRPPHAGRGRQGRHGGAHRHRRGRCAPSGHRGPPHSRACELGITSDEAFQPAKAPAAARADGGRRVHCAWSFPTSSTAWDAEVDVVYRPHLAVARLRRGHPPAPSQPPSPKDGRAPAPERKPCTSIEPHGDARRVTLTNGHVIETDLVFFAVGRTAQNRPGLASQDSRHASWTGNGAVVVDEENTTSLPHVFAIGDVSATS